MERLSDAMFIGFAIHPEWDPSTPLNPAKIQIDLMYSRHFQQIDSYRLALQRIQDIIRQELSVPHVYGFPSHLRGLAPEAGQIFDQETQRIMVKNMVMARDLPAPSIPNISSFALRHPTALRDIHLLRSPGLSHAATATPALQRTAAAESHPGLDVSGK